MSSAAVGERKYPPKSTKTYSGLAQYENKDVLESQAYNLEREMRSLHSRLAQIESNTDQRLAALGQRLHTLTKTVDNLSASNSDMSILKSTSSYSSLKDTNKLTGSPISNKQRWSSPSRYDRPSSEIGSKQNSTLNTIKTNSASGAGEDSEFLRTRLLSTENREADRLRSELAMREVNLAQQEKELTTRRNQLLARVRDLASSHESSRASRTDARKDRDNLNHLSRFSWKEDSNSQIVF